MECNYQPFFALLRLAMKGENVFLMVSRYLKRETIYET
jgi:hypothetical protein